MLAVNIQPSCGGASRVGRRNRRLKSGFTHISTMMAKAKGAQMGSRRTNAAMAIVLVNNMASGSACICIHGIVLRLAVGSQWLAEGVGGLQELSKVYIVICLFISPIVLLHQSADLLLADSVV